VNGATQRVLILMSDTGGGHRSAAEAISDALAHDFPSRYQVTLVDVIQRTAVFPFNHVADWYLPFTTYAEFLWRLLFYLTNNRVVVRGSRRLVDLLMGRSLGRLLREQAADLVVSVHPVLIAAPHRALRATGSRAPFVTVVTDLFSAHRIWFNPAVDYTLVPTEGARQVGLRCGIRPERMRVVGLPVSLEFLDQRKSKAEYRAELGLDAERTTVLIVGGGEGMGHIFEIVRAIDAARLPLQLVVIAGRNQKLFRKLTDSVWHVPVKTQGFVTNMPAWMRASDVIITKAGPGTISEALACGLPIVLSGFLPGQEEGNVTFVQESGVGILCERPTEIAQTLAQWLTPGDHTLADYAACARQLARPRAAQDIAGILDEVLAARKQSA
jgi:1,2-diacylglycerol 3-beta-galactosyltransferase